MPVSNSVYRYIGPKQNFNKTEANKELGISRQYITQVVKGVKLCTKPYAKLISMYLNSELEECFEEIHVKKD